jgi:hypothetical protein
MKTPNSDNTILNIIFLLSSSSGGSVPPRTISIELIFHESLIRRSFPPSLDFPHVQPEHPAHEPSFFTKAL